MFNRIRLPLGGHLARDIHKSSNRAFQPNFESFVVQHQTVLLFRKLIVLDRPLDSLFKVRIRPWLGNVFVNNT